MCSYNDFIFYTVLCSVCALNRVDLRNKARPPGVLAWPLIGHSGRSVRYYRSSGSRCALGLQVVAAPEILTVIREIPNLQEFLSSIYDCKYAPTARLNPPRPVRLHWSAGRTAGHSFTS